MGSGGANQYSQRGILRYEWIFGPGFVSSGEPGVTEELSRRVRWREGMRLLDVGSGLGGASRWLSRRYGARVTGVDLEPAMIELARARSDPDDDSGVTFVQGDVRVMRWPERAFDVIWSRDTLLHIADKEPLFARFREWLAPDGFLVLTDYSRAHDIGDGEFEAYVARSGYSLLDLEGYRESLERSGFRAVLVEDRTRQFITQTERELARLEHGAEEFLREFTREDFDYLCGRWRLRLRACRAGDMRWAWISARGTGAG